LNPFEVPFINVEVLSSIEITTRLAKYIEKIKSRNTPLKSVNIEEMI